MIVRIFKTNQVYIYAFIPLVLIALRWPVFFEPAPFTPSGQLPFLADFFSWLSNYPWLSVMLSAFVITYQAYLLSEMINEHRLVPYSSNLTAFILAISYAVFAPQAWLSPVILSNLFSVMALKRILNIYHQGEIRGTIFRAGIFIGLAAVFYLPSTFLMLILFYDLYVIRSFNWREFTIPIVGWLAPFIYLFAWYFIKSETDIFWNYFIEPKTFLAFLEFLPLNWLAGTVALVLIIASFIYLLLSVNKRTVRENNLFKVISLALIISMLLSFLYANDFMSANAMIWPYSAVLLTYFVLGIERNWLRESLMYLLVLSIVGRDIFNAI